MFAPELIAVLVLLIVTVVVAAFVYMLPATVTDAPARPVEQPEERSQRRKSRGR